MAQSTRAYGSCASGVLREWLPGPFFVIERQNDIEIDGELGLIWCVQPRRLKIDHLEHLIFLAVKRPARFLKFLRFQKELDFALDDGLNGLG